MNQERRKRIEAAIAELEAAKEDEQAAFDALPESLQSNERGEAMDAAISSLDEAIASAQSAVDGG